MAVGRVRTAVGRCESSCSCDVVVTALVVAVGVEMVAHEEEAEDTEVRVEGWRGGTSGLFSEVVSEIGGCPVADAWTWFSLNTMEEEEEEGGDGSTDGLPADMNGREFVFGAEAENTASRCGRPSEASMMEDAVP